MYSHHSFAEEGLLFAQKANFFIAEKDLGFHKRESLKYLVQYLVLVFHESFAIFILVFIFCQ